ncbi:MAG: transglycosylase domain-containing protein [Anaerorhabdus sp.]
MSDNNDLNKKETQKNKKPKNVKKTSSSSKKTTTKTKNKVDNKSALLNEQKKEKPKKGNSKKKKEDNIEENENKVEITKTEISESEKNNKSNKEDRDTKNEENTDEITDKQDINDETLSKKVDDKLETDKTTNNLNDNEKHYEETIILKKITDIEDIEKSKKKKSSFFKKFLATIIILIISFGLIITLLFSYFAFNIIKNRPELNINDFVSEESSIIYDNEGLVVSELGAYLRENVKYEDLPTSVIDAFVSIEDSRYFSHPGFDIPRFTKALIENIKTMSFEQGGSTFTMQLVKNTYFTIDSIENSKLATKSIDRKLQEIFLALELENIMNKDEILVKYLNKLNFGGNIRGIQKASLYYFGKNVYELNLSESALLAGIVNLPNAFNPYNYLDRATDRRNTVLDLMVRHGYISDEEAALAKAIKVEDLLIGENYVNPHSQGENQSYIDAVVEEVIALTGKDPSLNSMKIYTYMDKEVQSAIEDIQNGDSKVVFPDDLMQTAMISIDNRTGAIVGVGGGRNYEGARLLNRATQGFKQPGSSVKPFLSYALAFEHLYWSNKHVLTDRPYVYRGGTLLMKNYDGKYRGDILIDQALAQSLNIPAIETLQEVIDKIGKEEVAKYLQTIGFSKVTEDNFDISFAIGGNAFVTTVLEMAGAHATIINKGVYNKPHTIQKIVMQDGTTIYPENTSIKVLSSGAAYLTAQLMEYCVDGPYINYMQILRRKFPVYAKSGTSDWGSDGPTFNIPRGAAKDKWMVSSTTEYTNAVWVGYDKGVKDKDTYFSNSKSRLNIPGNISSILLDVLNSKETSNPSSIEKPNDIETITYVLGSYPYAYLESWMSPSLATTAEIRKGHPELTSINESFSESTVSNTLSGLDVNVLEDGTLTVTWHAGGRCANGTKDLSLETVKGYIHATGACILDPAIVYGTPSYQATVYIDGAAVKDIHSDNGYYYGWPGEIYGAVKVCGTLYSGSSTSNTVCATP